MKVEKVGEDRKKWVVLLSVLGVIIVGLVVAIVVILVTRNNEPQIAPSVNDEYDETLFAYYVDNEEIADRIVKENLEGEDLLKVIKEKIDAAENRGARAMLEQDYYLTMFATYGPDDETKKEEIMNGLIRANDVLLTARSAEMVATTALSYHDYATYEQYIGIAKDRDPSIKSIDEMLDEKGIEWRE
ncbi:hypothetical protein IKG07_00085 [Candidatus Saccharibacteria bacterium]|nr:hypothetical protein [Candidatus Saccharibacteria bacterium]